MHDNDHIEDGSRHGVSTRTMEIAVAAVILLLSLVVIFDSRRVGAGWADDGPQAGYFPFYIGMVLCAASAWTLLARSATITSSFKRAASLSGTCSTLACAGARRCSP